MTRRLHAQRAIPRAAAADLVFVNYTEETFTDTQSGALSTYVWECARAAERRGISVHVISRQADTQSRPWPALSLLEPPREYSGRAGHLFTRVQRKLLGVPRQRQVAWTRRVAAELRRLQVEDSHLVLQNDPETAVMLRRLLPDARMTLLFQNQLPSGRLFRSRLRNSVNVIAAVSDYTARWVEAHYDLQPHSVRTVYSGVDASAFVPRSSGAAAAPVIGFVGRTGREKGPDLLLQAALILARDLGPVFSVQLIGDNHWDRHEQDDFQEHLDSLCDELDGLGVAVDRPGHVSRADLPGLLAGADIHVVPSRWDEPFGLTTLEGMSCGLAVVASATGGSPEVVGDAGLLFVRDDPADLARQLHGLICQPERRAALGEAARQRALDFTWDRTLAALHGNG